MVWRKPTPELIQFLDEVLAGYDSQRKPMFGSPVYWVNGNMSPASIRTASSCGCRKPIARRFTRRPMRQLPSSRCQVGR